MLDLMKSKWRELLFFIPNKKHPHLSEKELKPTKVPYIAFEDFELAIALNEYVEIIKNNSCYFAAGIAIGIVAVTLICLASPIAAYLTAAGMTVGVITMNIRYFVEISDNLY
ncbi:MAG: hypothetical protein IT265_10080 [Saprospiraceae bacterium]|nr:hypothetical protein [Saprospiraceae bacterium]